MLPPSHAGPNVLLIVADDHAPYVYGAYGNSRARTPNLDRLASEGMRFERAYCNSPMCTPSRQSFLTGRYPRSVGVTLLRDVLDESTITMAETFSAHGYATAAIGKMHFNSGASHGFQLRVDRPQHRALLKAREATPLPEGLEVLGKWRPFQTPAAEWLNADYRPYPAAEIDMAPNFFVDAAAKFLHQDRQEPFFLLLSFYQPHSPFHFPVEYAGRFDPTQFEVPVPGAEDDWQIPNIFRNLSTREKQGIIASYYTSVEYLDSNIGRVLGALDDAGHADDTIVVYIGDHGYSLGQHGRFEKHTMYEPAVRSPLVVRYPKRVAAGSVSQALVEFVDLFPTLTSLCGIAQPDTVQGRSFEAVLKGDATEHREHVIVEYGENEEIMIRDGRYKLIYGTGQRHRDDGYETRNPTPGRRLRLYDTKSDPDEFFEVTQRAYELCDPPASPMRPCAEHLTATAAGHDVE